MSRAQLPTATSRREMRKTLVRLRMEMHRQEIPHEAGRLVNPMERVRNMTRSVKDGLGIKHAPLWGVAGVALLGFLSGKGARNGGVGSVSRLVKLGASLVPLLKLLQTATRK